MFFDTLLAATALTAPVVIYAPAAPTTISEQHEHHSAPTLPAEPGANAPRPEGQSAPASVTGTPSRPNRQDQTGPDHDNIDHRHMGNGTVGQGAGASQTHSQTVVDHAGMDHTAMAGMNHSAMSHSAMNMHGMRGMLGGYDMMRDASGTAWQPDTSPMWAIMSKHGAWSTMIHGFATLVYDDQGGPRGDRKTFVASMLMGMAQRQLGLGTLTLRAMGSLDPLMGKSGYPLLLATGETADGRTELVDRQHPHDVFMELSATYSRPLGGDLAGFVYLALPGEPALGPATYMHRFSGMADPEAPISHHWLDSTHVTFGVATAGLVYKGLKIEASLFTGREPDQHRWDIERPRMDSWSVRATVNPTGNLSAQVSHGYLRSPEGLHPDEDVRRTSASVTWNLPLGSTRNWQSTLAWGRNDPTGAHHGHVTDAFLLDSAVQLGRWTIFGRAEIVDKDELFGDDHNGDPLAGRVFNVGKLSVGGYHAIPIGKVALDVGGLVSKYDLPRDIQPRYGSDPTSVMVFARLRITG